MNFNRKITKDVAIELIKPRDIPGDGLIPEYTSLKDALGIEVMCKEYGDDEDWVGMEEDDFEMLCMDWENYYKTFEIWY